MANLNINTTDNQINITPTDTQIRIFTGGFAAPGGANTQVQYNNNGKLDGTSRLVVTSTGVTANGNINFTGVAISNNGANGYWLNSSGNNVGKLYYGANAVKVEATDTTSNIQLAANGTVRLSIFAGNGLTSINGPLTASGNVNTANLFANGFISVGNTGVGNYSNINILRAQSYNGDPDQGIAYGTTTEGSVDVGRSYAWRTRATGNASAGISSVTEGIVRGGTWTERMRIASDGTLSVAGNITITGNPRRIISDFSNATFANRTAFQTSTANSVTSVGAIPNGTPGAGETRSQFVSWNTTDPGNSSYAVMQINDTIMGLGGGKTGTGTALPLGFYTDAVERMRINATGELFLNTTTTTYGYANTSLRWQGFLLLSRNTTADTNQIVFFNPNGGVGAINTNGNVTVYGTTSDYRLKDNVQPMTGALDRIAALKPVTYNWKGGDAVGEGFIAHELQAVCPSAVSGEKDAVYEDGSIKPQTIDTSYLVPILVKAMQEQQAIITDLQNKIAALESAK